MCLVNYQLVVRSFKRHIAFPVKVIKRNFRPVLKFLVPIRLFAPNVSAADYLRIRVEQTFSLVESQPAMKIIFAVDAEAVFQIFIIQIENNHGKYAADSITLRIRNHRERLFFVRIVKHQLTRLRARRVNRKIHAARHNLRAVG